MIALRKHDTFYLHAAFHTFYAACKVKTDDEALTDSRLKLVSATKTVTVNTEIEVEADNMKEAEKKAIEDARFVLPNACETQMVVTMNARSLHNFFRHRCCNRAQWEIKDVADQMLALVLEVAPNLFKNAGPSCVSGGCPEGKMTCGKIKEIREFYKGLKENG